MLERAQLFTALSKAALASGVAFVVASAAASCAKAEGQSTGTPGAPTAVAAPSGTPSVNLTGTTPVPVIGTAALSDAGLTAAAEATGTTRASAADAGPRLPSGAAGEGPRTTPAAAASAGTPAASASAGAAECGTKPLPDCPLQAWMKANTTPAVAGKDFPALATALDKIVTFAPPGYTNWASIAKDGARAARGEDLAAAKASCRACHDQYKDRYKKEMRARKI